MSDGRRKVTSRDEGFGGLGANIEARRRKGAAAGKDRPDGSATAPAAGSKSPKTGVRRKREKTGRHHNDAYPLKPAYVLEGVHDRAMQMLRDPQARVEIEAEMEQWGVVEDLRSRGVSYRVGKPTYSDLVEMLLRRYLEEKEWGFWEDRPA